MKAGFAILVSLLLFCFVGLADVEKQSCSLGETEIKRIDEALKSIKMTRKDLLFKRDVVNDAHRLKIISKLLADPLEVPKYMDDVSRSVTARASSLAASLETLYETLDCGKMNIPARNDLPLLADVLEKAKAKVVFPDDIARLPERIRDSVALILNSALTAKKKLENAFGKLTKKDRDVMLFHLAKSLVMSRKGKPLVAYDVPGDDDMTKKFLELQSVVDYKEILLAAGDVFSAAEEARKRLSALDVDKIKDGLSYNIKGVTGGVVLHIKTELGDFIVGGAGENTYSDSPAFIIDIGGDDVYRGRVGAAVGFVERFVSVSLDLSGDDIYTSNVPVSQGSGFMGIGALIDVSGDDLYRGSDFTQGCGVLGVGAVMDLSGNDRYSAGYMAQGAGCFGGGFILEEGGDDNFSAIACCQAFGFVKGVGIIHEKEGNDIYFARGNFDGKGRYHSMAQGFGWGWRPIASGGVGILVDDAGHDSYKAIFYAQGCSYWFSVGVLIDGGGNDRYDSQVYGQGCGIHLSVGGLLERGGSDTYLSIYGGNQQGSAHDLAVGVLIDEGGNDTYVGAGNSQGSAINNAVAIFIDKSGDDHYYCVGSGCQGNGGEARGKHSIGIFLDLGGKDRYSSSDFDELKAKPGDDKKWTKGKFGTAIDTGSHKK